MTRARAFWTLAPGQGAIREEALPAPRIGEVRVRARYSGISRGTESLVFAGRVPANQIDAMRCPFQAGSPPGPVKYGYASVGTVEAGSTALAGRAVFCLHPHQDLYIVPESVVHPVPDEIPSERAVLAANMETALNVLWDSGIGPGDRVAVVGLGVVGLLAGWLARRIPGTEVLGLDVDPERRVPALALGLAFAAGTVGGYDADIVIHTSGQPAGLQTALTLAGVEASVLEAGWFGTSPVTLALGEAFHSRRLTLRSSQVGRVAPSRTPRWSTTRRLDKALSLLNDPALDVLIDGESRFDDLPETMAALADGRRRALCHRVRY